MDDFIENIFKDIDNNIKFDENQKNIIKYNDSNLLVIAGAGAGKTTTMSAKVNFMVNYLNVNPKEILVISFTNKAVDEIDEYINKKMKLGVDIFTFHKLAKNILEKEEYRFNLINDDDTLINKIIKKNNDNNKVINFLWRKKRISKIFNSTISKNDVLIKYTIENIKLIKAKMYDISLLKKDIYINFLCKIIKELDDYKYNNNLLNFDDLILKSIDIVNTKNFSYKYVIIDEYQDISKLRFEFVNKIKEKCIITAVGDDWQSIYSFAGSDINLFLNFSNTFKSKEMTIQNTYRNSQELIDIAGKFVMKDKKLIKKRLISNKNVISPISIIKNNDLEKAIKYLISKYGPSRNILILGRYKSDIKFLNNNFKIKGDSITYIYNSKVKITFLTIHSSKGLGYDNVIILNNNKDINSFPSFKEQDYFKKEHLKLENPIDEERRLFYVGVTRTKNEVILVYSEKKSIFLKEIKKEVKKLKI